MSSPRIEYSQIWINPSWTDEADEKLYGEGGFYSGEEMTDRMAEAVMRGMIELGINPANMASRILDYGSGTGALVRRIEKDGNKNVFSYDPITSPRMPAGRFDFITCVHVIEHARDPINLLGAIRKKLSPDGLLCLVCHNVVGTPNARAREPWHRWLFGRSLVDIINASGYIVIDRLTWGGCTAKAKWIKEPINWARKKLGIGDVQMILAKVRHG